MLSRRKLIAAMNATAALSVSALALPLAARSGRVLPNTAFDALSAFCSNLRCPTPIGRACLQALPTTEAAPVTLGRLILASAATDNFASAAALRRALRKRIRADFRAGKTVSVEGWLFSLTETRVYALSALLGRVDGSSPNGV